MTGREPLCVALAAVLGCVGLWRLPFPDDNVLLALLQLERPAVFYGVKSAYLAMLFTTPYIACSVLVSLSYIFLVRPGKTSVVPMLPPYPDPARRGPAVCGSGRGASRQDGLTRSSIRAGSRFRSAASTPASPSSAPSGPARRRLHVSVRRAAPGVPRGRSRAQGSAGWSWKSKATSVTRSATSSSGTGARDDYVEVSLDSPYRYNPLHNDLDAYALAYGIATLMTNLFGRGKEPFWQQASTNLVKFVILLHQILDDYVTLFQVYEHVINPGQAPSDGSRKASSVRPTGLVAITVDDFHRRTRARRVPLRT